MDDTCILTWMSSKWIKLKEASLICVCIQENKSSSVGWMICRLLQFDSFSIIIIRVKQSACLRTLTKICVKGKVSFKVCLRELDGVNTQLVYLLHKLFFHWACLLAFNFTTYQKEILISIVKKIKTILISGSYKNFWISLNLFKI